MKITLKQLSDSVTALEALAAIQFPAKVSYRLGRVLTSAQTELEIFRKAHIALVQKYGTQGESEGSFVVPNDRLDEFRPEFEGLLAETCEVWGDPIHIDLLGEVAIAPSTLAPLSWLIVDGTEEKAKAASA